MILKTLEEDWVHKAVGAESLIMLRKKKKKAREELKKLKEAYKFDFSNYEGVIHGNECKQN